MGAEESCARSSRAARSSRDRAGTTAAGGCRTSTGTRVFAIDPDGDRASRARGRGPAVRARAGCPTARCSSSRCRTTRLLRRAPDGEVSVHADLTEHCGGHLNDLIVDALRPRLRGQLRLRPHALRRPGADEPGARRPRRHRRTCEADDLLVPERHGHRRRHADRGRDLRRAPDGVHDRRRRRAGRPARVGPDRADGRAGAGRRDAPAASASRPTASLHGRRGPHLGRRRARRADVPDRARRRHRRRDPAARRASARSPASLGGEDGRTLLLCSAPDFIEANRKDVREAVLFTTTVDVPHGGRP